MSTRSEQEKHDKHTGPDAAPAANAAPAPGDTSGPGPEHYPPRPSELYAFRENFTWDGIEVRRYKPQEGGWEGIVRQVITGWGHETSFHVRYFEIAPGGYSSLEKHGHAHVVITIRGHADVVVGDRRVRVKPFDVLYLKPWEPHQFVNTSGEPYGFLCVVDGERDRPRDLDPGELERIMANPDLAPIVKVQAPSLERAE